MRVNHLFALAVLLWVGSPGHASPSSDTSIASPHGCEVMAKDLEGMNSLPNTLEVNTERAAKLYAYANRGCGKATEAHKKEFLDSYRQLSAECKRARGRNCDPLNALERPTVQASGANSVPPDNSRNRLKAGSPATNASSGARPIWPSDMEPGNVYFVVETGTGQEEYAPIMVSALSGQEAVARVQTARAKDRSMTAGSYKLLAGRECIGPAWGAVVQIHSAWWGGACANTPAAAIEGAFIACRQRSPQGQDCGQSQVDIVLVLSGSTSWNPAIYQMGNSEFGGFGSYAAQTYMSQYTTRPVKSMQQALTGFDKACDDRRPCYKTSSNMRCLHETPTSESVEKCMDRKLTPAGLSGSIRNRMR